MVEYEVYLLVVLPAQGSRTEEIGTCAHQADDNIYKGLSGHPYTENRQHIGRHQMTHDNGVGKVAQLAH